MAQILILTDDKRLFRMLSILIAEAGHTFDTAAPSLIITDKKDLPARLSTLPCLRIGEGGMPRPFSHALLKTRVEELLSQPALPPFSPTEERLFRALRDASPEFVSRDELVRAVFGEEEDGGRLNLYIHYLRKKIETDGKRKIFAHRGKGYSLIC